MRAAGNDECVVVGYLDCFSGISGDMCLGAVIDAGVDVEELRRGLESIEAIRGEWALSVETVWKGRGRLRATHVHVESKYDAASLLRSDDDGSVPSESHAAHDHAHHSHSHSHAHGHDHGKEEEEGDGDGQAAEETSSGAPPPVEGPQRNLSTIVAMITSAAGLPAVVKTQSIAVFNALASAEARAHGCALEEVHFHEVGAVDSIVDTVGAVFGFHLLGIKPGSLYCSALPLGHGRVWTQHGLMPVPVPATLELMRAGEIPTTAGPPGAAGELVTPTGASIVCAIATVLGSAPPPGFVVRRVGIGAGTREYAKHPNVMRLLVGSVPVSQGGADGGEAAAAAAAASPSTRQRRCATEELALLEANVDDMSPELLGFCCERLLALGALDVWLEPIVMKKWRAAQKLAVLCRPGRNDVTADALLNAMLRETTTLGVRRSTVARTAVERRFETVQTPWGDVAIKVGVLDGEVVNAKPEFEDCKRLALQHGVPCKLVVDAAAAMRHHVGGTAVDS